MSAEPALGLAKAGIGVGGAYYGETFYNWGGFDQGGEYDGVLELYINADMKKLGLWKGFCFFANGYQIHGNSITAANIGSLMPVSNLEAHRRHAPVRDVVRAASVQRQGGDPLWPACGRRRVHHQRGRRLSS